MLSSRQGKHLDSRDLTRYALSVATIVAITISSYGRLTGFDGILEIAGRSELLADVLFAAAVAIGAISSTLLLSIGSVSSVIRIVTASAMAIGTGSLALVAGDSNPSETLRFVWAPVATAALPLLGLMNILASSRDFRRIASDGGNRQQFYAGIYLSLAIGCIAASVASYFVTNSVGPKGFFVQHMLILLGAVSPLIASLAALRTLAYQRRLLSLVAATFAIIAAGSLTVLATL